MKSRAENIGNKGTTPLWPAPYRQPRRFAAAGLSIICPFLTGDMILECKNARHGVPGVRLIGKVRS